MGDGTCPASMGGIDEGHHHRAPSRVPRLRIETHREAKGQAMAKCRTALGNRRCTGTEAKPAACSKYLPSADRTVPMRSSASRHGSVQGR